MGRSQRGPDSAGRFAGSNRVNVEDVPRLPTFPAAWTLSDPRGRPYFVFWTSPHDGTVTRVLRMESVQQGSAVQLTIPDVGVFQIPIIRRPLPRRRGFSILYRCRGCGKPRRHLYLRSLVIGRLVDYQGPLCTACAGLRWASQSEVLVTLAALTGGIARPLSPIQFLWMNLLSDVLPALALASEPPEPQVMDEAPSRDSSILSFTALRRIAADGAVLSAGTLASYVAALGRHGIGSRSSTVAFSTLTAAQLLHAVTCRSDARPGWHGLSE